MAPDLEKDLLGQFLGVLAVAAEAVGQVEHPVLVPPHQLGEGVLVAAAARRAVPVGVPRQDFSWSRAWLDVWMHFL